MRFCQLVGGGPNLAGSRGDRPGVVGDSRHRALQLVGGGVEIGAQTFERGDERFFDLLRQVTVRQTVQAARELFDVFDPGRHVGREFHDFEDSAVHIENRIV